MAPVFRLQIDEPGNPPRVVAVGQETEIGRDCDGIVLDDPTASRRHARIEPTDIGLVLTDLGSSNGTIAGGEPVDEPMVLSPGAWFQIGETRIVVHEGREGDTHQVAVDHDVATPDRVSEGLRDLNQAAAHTLRPGGPAARPPRS